MNSLADHNVISAERLSVTFRQGRRTQIKALDAVDLSINEKDIFGLLGPNGAGKSTAMYCFLGLLRPTSGHVNLLGHRPRPGSEAFEDIAYLPEEPHYHPYLTVEEAVRYYAGLYRRSVSMYDVNNALKEVGLIDYRRLRIAKCSKGMKQKVGLAACMLFAPRILFLDEPTRGLDPIMVRTFRDHLVKVNEQGTTIVLNSHILSEVELVCSRVAIMNKGKVLADDVLENLIQSQHDMYEVIVDAGIDWPDYACETDRAGGITTGTIEGKDLERFVGYCRINDVRLQSCRLQTETLEDVFMRVVNG